MAKLQKPKIKNPELRMAVAEWKGNRNEVTEEKMIDALKKAQYIAPAIIEGLPDDIGIGEKRSAQAKFMLVRDNNGTKFFPAFTEWLEVLKWNNNPDTDSVVVTFDQYAALLLRQNAEARGIVVDPKGMNLMIPAQMFAKAMGLPVPGQDQQMVTKEVQMKVTENPEYPPKLMTKLKEQLELDEAVGGAYIAQMENRDDPKQKSYFIVLDMADINEEARKVILNQIGKICRPYVDIPIGIIPIQTPAGYQLAKTHEPFYTAEGYNAKERLDVAKEYLDKVKETANKGNADNSAEDATAEENRKNIVQE